MRREDISFEDFKTHFIGHAEGGYYSVWSSIVDAVDHYDDDETTSKSKFVYLDMICEWRLMDGKVKFYAIEIETVEQLEEIKAYLRLTRDFLSQSITEYIEGMVWE